MKHKPAPDAGQPEVEELADMAEEYGRGAAGLAAPSAPASAARKVAERLWREAMRDYYTESRNEFDSAVKTELEAFAAEQTRQLREELAEQHRLGAHCWRTYYKAMTDAGVPYQTVASTEDETFTSKGIRWLAKDRDEWRQRAQAAEALVEQRNFVLAAMPIDKVDLAERLRAAEAERDKQTAEIERLRKVLASVGKFRIPA